jgi:glucan biosynthesis protein C
MFDLLAFFIHLFRMPVFFVAAGFFAAMLMQRDGRRAFIVNRGKRVLLPLVLFWPIVMPAVGAGFLYATTRAGSPLDLTAMGSGSFLRRPVLGHLWFLWDLTLFYAALALFVPLASRMPERWSRGIDSAFRSLATTISGALAMSLVTAATLLPMAHAGLDTSGALLPPMRVLVAYGVFFTFGWLLYRRRDIIEAFARGWKGPMLAGAGATVAYLVVAIRQPFTDPRLGHVVGCALAGLAIWMLIYGIVGAFVRLLDRPRPVVRYLSDASYWMYIVHLPFTIAVPGVLAPFAMPAALKFAITLTVTTAATLVSYHYMVRSTAIGALLSGRRYPRKLTLVGHDLTPVGQGR